MVVIIHFRSPNGSYPYEPFGIYSKSLNNQCPGQDSNLHALTGLSTSRINVYQFRHPGITTACPLYPTFSLSSNACDLDFRISPRRIYSSLLQKTRIERTRIERLDKGSPGIVRRNPYASTTSFASFSRATAFSLLTVSVVTRVSIIFERRSCRRDSRVALSRMK